MKIPLLSAVAAFSFAASAQLAPGAGVANDHAAGRKNTDVVFVQRGGGNGYGYVSYDTAVGVTLFHWSLPNSESSVKGLRLNLGWGGHADVYGVDAGLFAASRSLSGVSATFLGSFTEEADGVQIGLVNVTKDRTAGLQLGLVNSTDSLCGVQIGLLNFSWSQWSIPIINAAF